MEKKKHVEVKDDVRVDDCKDHLLKIKHLEKEKADLVKALTLWRELGKHHGPVSGVENINQVLIKLKAMGELD